MDTNNLDFESPIVALEKKIAELENFSSMAEVDLSDEIGKLRQRADRLKTEIYKNLSPWQRVLLARHPNRPVATDFINLIFTDFVELFGDRSFHDDKAIICGLGKINDYKVMLVANRRGKTTQERIVTNFGCPHPEGYRKSLLKMQMAEKFKLPIITLINTPGAYPGIGAEERGQAHAIARNIFEMSRLRTPIICVVTGEGGSGGALAIGVGDKLVIMENAYFSVISPEGCAALLWRDSNKAPEAARALKLTSKDLFQLGIADEVIAEPLGGAHRDYKTAAENLKQAILRYLAELTLLPTETLVQKRYEKYRAIGKFMEKQQQVVSPGK